MAEERTGKGLADRLEVGARAVDELDLDTAGGISPGQSERLAGLDVKGAVGEDGLGVGDGGEDANDSSGGEQHGDEVILLSDGHEDGYSGRATGLAGGGDRSLRPGKQANGWPR